MATRKPAKKATKKTTAKKTAKPKVKKRAYNRKPKIETTIEEVRILPETASAQETEAPDAGYSEEAYRRKADQANIEHLEYQVRVLQDRLNSNELRFDKSLSDIGKKVYLDLQHLNDQKKFIAKVLVAHALGAAGYINVDDDGPANDRSSIHAILEAQILVLNTQQKFFDVIEESQVDEGTPLYRITSDDWTPKLNVEFARYINKTILVDGVEYVRRS